MIRFLLFTLLLYCAPCVVQANENGLIDTRTEAFRSADWRYLEMALDTINQLTQSNYGSSLQQRPAHDLPLLQRLLDDNIVQANSPVALQAMGIALGEVLQKNHALEWRRYIDERGVSRALQLKHSDYTLFPITMISRRVSAGLTVDVAKLYQQALDNITAYQEQQREDYYNSL